MKEAQQATGKPVLVALHPASDLGGMISGEHGIGNKRLKYMPLCVSESYLNMVRAVKTALDPNGVLNPGKIFAA